jgi:hypothetical protein
MPFISHLNIPPQYISCDLDQGRVLALFMDLHAVADGIVECGVSGSFDGESDFQDLVTG